MSWFDCDPVDVYDDRLVTARRLGHACMECRHPIMPGERYHAVSTCQDGAWYHFKVCTCCQAKRCALSDELAVPCIPFGCLAEAEDEWLRETGAL